MQVSLLTISYSLIRMQNVILLIFFIKWM